MNERHVDRPGDRLGTVHMSAQPPVRSARESPAQQDTELSAQEELAAVEPQDQDASDSDSAHEALRRQALAAAERFDRFRAPETPESEMDFSPGNVEAHLRLETHRIEKGMSIGAPRRPYGQLAQERIEYLLRRAAYLSDKHEGLISAEEQARDVLRALEKWNDQPEMQSPEHRDPAIVRPYQVAGKQTPHSHARRAERTALDPPNPSIDLEDAVSSMGEFFLRRSSVRSFDPDRHVTTDSMEQAVRIALNTPSVCNRATGRVHFYRGAEKIAPLLALQQGNRGLTGIQRLAIVTVELSMFAGIKEFAQPWIDGGLFLMNLVWGFQVQGIGSCLLNWCMPEDVSQQLRTVADIPESELVISMMAFGYPQEGTYLTRSAKPPLPQVMILH